jgi:hypothetical protein
MIIPGFGFAPGVTAATQRWRTLGVLSARQCHNKARAGCRECSRQRGRDGRNPS